MTKTQFWKWWTGRPPCWIWKILNFSEMTAIVIGIRFCAPNFIKIRQLCFTDIWRFKNSKCRPYAIWDLRNLQFMSRNLSQHAILLHLAKFAEIWQSLAELYWKKTIFNMAAVRHLALGSFCHAVFVGMICCFLVQNFAEIGQSCMLRRLISCCIITFNKRSK